MDVIIKPSKLSGEVVIPPSKSLSHRAIIAASLAKGKSKISNVMFSNDILATISGMEAMGAKITKYDNYLEIEGSNVIRKNSEIDANESGSTLRFLIPIALTISEAITFIGHNNLVNRPLDTFFEIFDEQNIKYEKPNDTYLPLKCSGSLKAGEYKIRGDISSQFITGLLFSLPLLDGTSKIILTTPLESLGYIDLTIDILNMFGVKIINNNYEEFIIEGNQEYKPCDYEIEGDFSQAAFFLVADTMGANVSLKAMNINSHQGDKKILEDIKSMGGKIEYKDGKLKALPSKTKGAILDFKQTPDLGPALSVLALNSKGDTEFINAGRLRIKESDRISSVKEELEKLGVEIVENPDGMTILGPNDIIGGTLDPHNDHRLRMAFSMLCQIATGDIKIINAECVKKSYPHFFKDLESIGGKVIYE